MRTSIPMVALACLCIGCGDRAQRASQDAFIQPPDAASDGGVRVAADLADGRDDLVPRDLSLQPDLASAVDGAAQADGGDTAGLPTWPGLTPLQLTSDQVSRFFVAADEAHVGFSHGVSTSDFGCEGRIGLGDLSVVAIANGAATVSAIEDSAGLNETGFSGDGKWIFYTQYDKSDPCTLGADAYKAATDGSKKDLLSGGGALYFKDIAIQGGGARWRAFGSSSSDPGTLYAATFANSGPTLDVYGATLLSDANGDAGGFDPTGRALVYDDGNKTRLAQLASGATVELSPAKLPVVYRSYWSPDGNTVALLSSSATSGRYSLSLLAHDGSNLRSVVPDCDCATVLFSPDGSRIVYDTTSTNGDAILVAHPLAGGADTQLSYPGVAPGGATLYFQGGSRWLHVRYQPGWDGYTLLVGDVTRTAPLVQVTDTLDPTGESSSGELIATLNLESSVSSVRVFSLANQTTTTVIADHAWLPLYEPVSANPRLAAVANFDSTTDRGDLKLYSTDGSQRLANLPAPAQVLGSNVPLPFWLGRDLFYAVNARTEPSGDAVFDLVVARDDGSMVGIIATHVLAVGWAPIAAPTQLFYSTSGGGLYRLAAP